MSISKSHVSKMMLFQITSNDKVSHLKVAYTCDTLHPSIQFQTWNLHKNLWNFIKLHRSTQFQTWKLCIIMIHCIVRHSFKLRNDSFSNENGGPGILLAKATFKMHQKNVLVHALFRDPLFRSSGAKGYSKSAKASGRIENVYIFNPPRGLSGFRVSLRAGASE